MELRKLYFSNVVVAYVVHVNVALAVGPQGFGQVQPGVREEPVLVARRETLSWG